jgi:hypothetical protein
VNALLERAGLFRFVFVALLVLFCWPVLSIPAPENRLTWLFVVWLLAIVFMWLAAHMASPSAGAASGTDPAIRPPGSNLLAASHLPSDPHSTQQAEQAAVPPQTREGADV